MSSVSTQVVETGLVIGGEWRAPLAGERHEIRNPANPDEIVGYAAAGGRRDAEAAIAAAGEAAPAWGALSYHERADHLRRIVSRLDDEFDERVRLLVREHGKVLREATIELTRLGLRFEYTASLADRLAEEQKLEPPPLRSIVTKRPMGVAALIIPWNWPLSILGAKLPQALMAGNTVVIKPSSSSPLATVQTIKLMADALPPGVINVVSGPASEVGAALLESPLVRNVDFTGGIESGKQVMAHSAPTLKHLTLELGGNDPGIVLEDADVSDETIERMVVGAFLTAGQVCMALKRLYVHESLYPRVVEGLIAALDRYQVGNGLDERATMGPLNNERQLRFVRELVAETRSRGATVRELGSKLNGAEFERGYFMLPTLVTEVDDSFSAVKCEQFGPLLPVMSFRTEDEAVRRANDSSFGLCSSVWSADVERAISVARRLEAGYSYINHHGPFAHDYRVPFGGMKQSGIGRQLGLEKVLEFVDYQSISIYQ